MNCDVQSICLVESYEDDLSSYLNSSRIRLEEEEMLLGGSTSSPVLGRGGEPSSSFIPIQLCPVVLAHTCCVCAVRYALCVVRWAELQVLYSLERSS